MMLEGRSVDGRVTRRNKGEGKGSREVRVAAFRRHRFNLRLPTMTVDVILCSANDIGADEAS